MYSKFVICLSLVFYILQNVQSDPVSFITRCKVTDEECMKKSAKAALPVLSAGIPEIDVPSSEPLLVKHVESNDGGLSFKFTNILTKGLSKCDFNKLSFALETKKFNLEIVCKLDISGNYEMNGKLLILPIEGNGPFNIDCKKLRITVTGDLENKKDENGKSHYKITQFKYDSDPVEPMVFRFQNLYNGNEALSKATHDFANQNYKEILNELGKPILHGIYTKAIKTVNKVFKAIPSEELFLN